MARMALQRVNQSVLGALERPMLVWFARRLPSWIFPDHLTVLGFLGALLAAAGFILSRSSIIWLWLSCLGLVLNWFGDSLDGTLARLRRRERPRYGFFIDHTSDMFSNVLVFISIGISPCTHFAVACLGLIAFLMAFVYTMIGTHVRQRMRITYFGFGPTEIRALLVVGNLLVLEFGVIDVHRWIAPSLSVDSISIHDVVISFMALVGALLIALLTMKEAGALGREDPPPVESK
jgi:archaetidylinositol phosphate synthase